MTDCKHTWVRLLGGAHLWRCSSCSVLGYDKPVAKTLYRASKRRGGTVEVVPFECSVEGCRELGVVRGSKDAYCEAHRERAAGRTYRTRIQ